MGGLKKLNESIHKTILPCVQALLPLRSIIQKMWTLLNSQRSKKFCAFAIAVCTVSWPLSGRCIKCTTRHVLLFTLTALHHKCSISPNLPQLGLRNRLIVWEFQDSLVPSTDGSSPIPACLELAILVIISCLKIQTPSTSPALSSAPAIL